MLRAEMPSVLVVEDEEDLLDELVELFELRGLRSLGVGCVDDAVALLSELAGPVTIIADLNLPRLSGVDLLRLLGSSHRLRSRVSAFILITGHTDLDESDRQSLRQCGAAILSKPVRVRDLLPLVERSEPVDWGLVEDGIQLDAPNGRRS